MAFTWGSKVNGILTVFTIGIAVLVDLWDILDIKKGYSMVSNTSFLRAPANSQPFRSTFGDTSMLEP